MLPPVVDRAIPIRNLVRAALALVVVGFLVWFFASGTFRSVDERLIREKILSLGPLGPIAFVLGFALIQPLGPSGHIFPLAASLVWSLPIAFALSLAGAVASQIVGFTFYRYVASDFARAVIPKRLRAYEERLVAKPVRTVLLIRLFTFTWPPVSALFGISNLRFAPMLVGTIVGLAPTIAFDVLYLADALRWVATTIPDLMR